MLQSYCKEEHLYKILDEMRRDIKHQVKSSIYEEDSSEAVSNRSSETLELKQQNRKAFWVAVHLSLMQQFSGINAIAVYGGYIVLKTDSDYSQQFSLATSAINSVQVVGTVFALFLFDRFGRKTLLQAGCFGSCISCIVIIAGWFLYQD